MLRELRDEVPATQEKWRTRVWRLAFGGKYDNECFFRGMMSADNEWLFSDNKEKLSKSCRTLTWNPSGVAVVDE